MRKLDSQSILKSRIKFLVEILVSNVNKVVSCYLIAAQKCCFSTHSRNVLYNLNKDTLSITHPSSTAI